MAGSTIVFANQKGGVGKTTTAVNLGAYVARMEKRVLLIDFDPQGNLSSSVGAESDGRGIYEVLSGRVPIADAIQKTTVEGLSIISSSIDLTGASIELIDVEEREFYLKEKIEQIKESFDYIFIDCPPSLGILTVNGLTAADYVIIPLQCEYFALEGLSLLLQTIQKIQKRFNPTLKIGGILFTMYDGRTKLSNEIVQDVTSYFKDKAFRTIIPRNVKLSEAPSHSVPVILYDPECSGAKSYEKLAVEVLSRV
jgi:chromosome partitioning protein